MTKFKDAAVHLVAREIARPRVRSGDGWRAWPEETRKAQSEAEEKINAMTNLELLEVIGNVLNDL